MRTDDSLPASWLPRHRVLHLSGRNVLLSLLCGLVGLGLLGWCLYWLNNDHDYTLAAYLLLPVGLSFLSLSVGCVLRFWLWLRLTQLSSGFSAAGCFLSVLFVLRLVGRFRPVDGWPTWCHDSTSWHHYGYRAPPGAVAQAKPVKQADLAY